MSQRRLIGTLVALSAVALTAVILVPQNNDTPKSKVEPIDQTPGSAAMRAYLDPETGRPVVGAIPQGVPLDEETRNMLRRDSAGLIEVHHPNGAVSVHLQGRFQNATVARIGEDGKVTICTDASDDAAGMLGNDARPVAKPAAEVK